MARMQLWPGSGPGPHLALLPVQVELVLADGHGPDGLDECWARVPRVHCNAAVAKGPPGHRGPAGVGGVSLG